MNIQTSKNFLVTLNIQEAVNLIQELAKAINSSDIRIGGYAHTEGLPIIEINRDKTTPSIIAFCVDGRK